MTKDEIRKNLEDLGIEYDARLGADKLLELLEDATSGTPELKTEPAKPESRKQRAFVVLRDYWPEEDVRVRKGTIVEMDPADAIDGVSNGSLKPV